MCLPLHRAALAGPLGRVLRLVRALQRLRQRYIRRVGHAVTQAAGSLQGVIGTGGHLPGGGADRGDQLFRHHLGSAGPAHMAGDHREFVAAQAPDDVVRAQAVAHPRGHFLQQPVTGGVAQAVVDFLEAVQIEEEHAQRASLAGRLPPGVAAVGLEAGAVEGAGQRVLFGPAHQLLAVGLFQGHVTQHHVHAIHVAVLVALRNENRVPGADGGIARVVEVHAVLDAGVGALQTGGEVVRYRRADQLQQRLADDLVLRPVQFPGPAGVDEFHPHVAVHEHQQYRQRIGQGGQAAVAAAAGRFGQVLGGHVLGGGEIAGDTSINEHGRGVHLTPHGAPVDMHEALFPGKPVAGAPGALPLGDHPLAVLGMDRSDPAVAQRLFLAQPGQPLPGAVDVGAAALGVGAQQAERCGVVDRFQFGGLGAQLARDALALGDVVGKAQHHLSALPVQQAVVIAPDPEFAVDHHRHQALVGALFADALQIGIHLRVCCVRDESVQPASHQIFRLHGEHLCRRGVHRQQHTAQRMGADQTHAGFEDVAVAALALGQLAARLQQLFPGLALAVFQLLAGLGQAQCAVQHSRLGVGLAQVILGAGGNGALAQVPVAPRQHHHRQLRVARHDCFKPLQVLAVGQAQIQQHGRIARVFQHAQRGAQ